MVRAILLVAVSVFVGGCAAPKGNTVEEKRAYALEVRNNALPQLYEKFPDLEDKVKSAAGYLFLSNFAIHPGWATFANGYGVLQDNSSQDVTHMRMFRFGIGPGISVKGAYALVVLENQEALEKLREGAMAFGGFVEACFNFGDFGGSAALEGMAGAGVEAYVWTHTGLGIELTLLGGKVWPKAALNDTTNPEP